MSDSLQGFKEVDFHVIKEDYSRYLLNDRTLLRIKVVVRKIVRSIVTSPTGYPDFAIDNVYAVSTIVPDGLKRPPSTDVINIQSDVPEEIPFVTQEEQWQEYHTEDGFKIFV